MDDFQFKHEKEFNYCKMKHENGRVVCNVLSSGKRIDIQPEQAVGSLFTKIKEILEINNIVGQDFVVSLPSFYS